MTKLEQQIDEIVEKWWDEMALPQSARIIINKQTFKLAVLDGYGLGLEAAREINKGEV